MGNQFVELTREEEREQGAYKSPITKLGGRGDSILQGEEEKQKEEVAPRERMGGAPRQRSALDTT